MPNILNEEATKPVTPPLKLEPINADEIAKKMKADRQLPVKPGNSVDFDTGIKWLGLLSSEQWKRICIYMYRLYPIINREPKYINVLTETPKLDDLIRTHGGGRYKFAVKDVDASRKDSDSFFEIQLEIPITQYDPILDYNELDMVSPKNRPYLDTLRLKGILDINNRFTSASNSKANNDNSNANEMMMSMFKDMLSNFMSLNREQQNAIKNGMKTDDTAINKALELVQKSGEAGIQMVTERFKSEDPTKMMTLMISMMEKLAPKADNSSDKFITLMMTLMQQNAQIQAEASKNQTNLLMQMLVAEKEKNNNSEEKDPFDQIEKVFKMAAMLGFRKGNPAESGGWVDKLVDMAPTALQVVGGIVQAAMNRGVGNAVQVPNSNNPNGNNMGSTGESETSKVIPTGYLARGYNPGYNPSPSPTLQSNTNPNNNVVEIPQGNKPMTSVQPFYADLIYNAMLQGVPGYLFAESVINMTGNDAYLQIKALGEENLYQAIRTDSYSWNKLGLFGEEKIKTFIHEFVNMQKILEELDKEDEE